MALCLLVEDQPLQRKTLERTLRDAGHQVVGCGTAEGALELTREHRPETILLDLGLPDTDGLEILPLLLEASPLSRIVVLTGRDSAREAVKALRAGARHYLVKPWDREELLVVLEREINAVNREESSRRQEDAGIFWGVNHEMRAIRDDLARLATSPYTSLLVQGETGTGKEVVARELHRLSAPPGSFVALNCTALPHELLESELFGHEKGAFTGATARKRGMVELANKGTLFLDEIGEMAAPLQSKLLRFLQDGSFRRLGAEEEHGSCCRVVAATLADLDRLQADGLFRADLYYRLAVVRMSLPPLRERKEDLLPLAHFLLEKTSRKLGRTARALSPRAEEALLAHSWPGNVRELANRLERAMVLGTGERIEPKDLDLVSSDSGLRSAPMDVLRDPHRLRALLDDEDWVISRVARRLGVERHRVKYRVRALGLVRPQATR